MYDLTPSQVFGLYLLIPLLSALAYLIGVGRTTVRMRIKCAELLDSMNQAFDMERDALEAPPYRGDHTNCTICKHRRQEFDAEFYERASPRDREGDHLVRGN